MTSPVYTDESYKLGKHPSCLLEKIAGGEGGIVCILILQRIRLIRRTVLPDLLHFGYFGWSFPDCPLPKIHDVRSPGV